MSSDGRTASIRQGSQRTSMNMEQASFEGRDEVQQTVDAGGLPTQGGT